MQMEIIEGNLLDITEGIIVHQVNCLGVMGRGLAAQIRANYPSVFKEYYKLCKSKIGMENELLGTIQLIPIKDFPPLRVANVFGQLSYAGSGVHTSYDALTKALTKLNFINTRKLKIYVPYLLGSDLAGGHWPTVKSIIEETIPNATIVVLPEKVAALGDNWIKKI